MKVLTPHGEIEAKAIEYSLEEAERGVKVVLGDGTVLFWRPYVIAVFTYTINEQQHYVISSNHGFEKIS